MVVEVGKNVSISNPESVNFRVTKEFADNACMVGSSLAFTGPVMCLANNYFTSFESSEILMNPEYREWKVLLDQIPDHPLEMGQWISSLSSKDCRRLHDLTKKFASVLTVEELKGVTAHELGHAKHLHAWKKLFFLIPMSWGAKRVADSLEPVRNGLADCLTFITTFLLFSLGVCKVQRVFEKEADEETAVSRSYSAGLKRFFKRHLVVELTRDSPDSAAKRVKEMIEGIDFFTHHPHPAKRLIAALERKKKPAHPISIWERGVALAGAALLIREISTAFLKFLAQIRREAQF